MSIKSHLIVLNWPYAMQWQLSTWHSPTNKIACAQSPTTNLRFTLQLVDGCIHGFIQEINHAVINSSALFVFDAQNLYVFFNFDAILWQHGYVNHKQDYWYVICDSQLFACMVIFLALASKLVWSPNVHLTIMNTSTSRQIEVLV